MPFISVSDEVAKKSFTSVENKFITKYLPVLDPVAVKVYLYSLYLWQSGLNSFTLTDLAQSLAIDEEQAKSYFEYLEEFELVSITNAQPFEVKILEADNLYGTPKKFKPEKYADFTKSVQNIIKGRMISTNEYREYFILLEEYGFEPNALLMIINYCVNLKGDDIRLAYIKKVVRSFADEGVTTAKKVDEKLSAYTSSTPAIIRIFNAAGIRKQPELDDEKLYKKWTEEMGFGEDAIISAAKLFKAKTAERLDLVMDELFKNRKFDVKEIADYFKNKNSVYALTHDISHNLGIYMQNSAPYVENYVNVWCNMGYTPDCLKKLSVYCFKHSKNSFEDMNSFIQKLYGEGIVTDESVDEKLASLEAEESLIRDILSACGLSRKIISWDRESLARWKSWNFSDEMIFEAAKISSGKSNPMAYINGVLSAWKSEGAFTPDKIPQRSAGGGSQTSSSVLTEREKTILAEKHYSALRQAAETKAERALQHAMEDESYAKIKRESDDLSIKYAFALVRDAANADALKKRLDELEAAGAKRLKELGINRDSFTPHYACKICNDTGYDQNGRPCECLERFLKTL